jgi:hypothetical protein
MLNFKMIEFSIVVCPSEKAFGLWRLGVWLGLSCSWWLMVTLILLICHSAFGLVTARTTRQCAPRKYAKHQASPQLKKIAHKAMHFISFDNDPRFDQIRPTMIDCDPRWPPRGGQRTKHKIRNCVVPSCQCQQSLEYPNQHGGDTYGTQCNIDRGFV